MRVISKKEDVRKNSPTNYYTLIKVNIGFYKMVSSAQMCFLYFSDKGPFLT